MSLLQVDHLKAEQLCEVLLSPVECLARFNKADIGIGLITSVSTVYTVRSAQFKLLVIFFPFFQHSTYREDIQIHVNSVRS